MDKSTAINLAKTYAKAIKEHFDYDRIILFGSYAKGTFTENSDIDIAIVFKDFKNSIDIQLELMRLRRKIDSRIEPHPFRKTEFNSSNPLAFEILKYGLEI